MTDAERIAALEQLIDQLIREVNHLRGLPTLVAYMPKPLTQGPLFPLTDARANELQSLHVQSHFNEALQYDLEGRN